MLDFVTAGEHGIGVEKIGFMSKKFTAGDSAAMQNLREAISPKYNFSEGRIVPTAGGCGMERDGTRTPWAQGGA